MKVIFCGGGTAGHISPALAMSEAITSKYKAAEIKFIGRQGGEENEAVRREGYALHTLDVIGIKRTFSLSNISAIIKAYKAISEATGILKSEQPNIIIGTGGYVSWPVIMAGVKLGIPTLIHESNALPGLVTRLVAKHVDCVLLGFNDAEVGIKQAKEICYTGTPVRRDFSMVDKYEARRRLGVPQKAFLCVSFGGSLGAEKMNVSIVDAMRELSRSNPRYVHVHATGKRYFGQLKDQYPDLCKSRGTRILPYIYDMPLWLCAADLAITRSGAITLAELSAAQTPAILIPSPNVCENHQEKNARARAAAGAATVITEDELTPDSLKDAINYFMSDARALSAMQSRSGSSDTESATDLFMDCFERFCRA